MTLIIFCGGFPYNYTLNNIHETICSGIKVAKIVLFISDANETVIMMDDVKQAETFRITVLF
jgi:hypothetical protein